MSESPLLEIRNLDKQFMLPGRYPLSRKVPLQALSGISLSIMEGEALGVVGESGSGKSTLGHVVLNLQKPTSGEVFFGGQRISGLSSRKLHDYRKKIQLVFQDPYSSLTPTQTIGAMLGEVLDVHKLLPNGKARQERVVELLEEVGLTAAAASRYPHEFSGGQRQRIVIARALATEPSLIVADEPVSALDVSIQAQIVQLITRLRRERGLTMMLIAHDLGLVQYMSDRIAVMYLGHLVELAPTWDLFSRPKHPYTEMLLSAAPVLSTNPSRQRIKPVGEIPSPLSPPSGCVFRNRCSYALPACGQAVPPLRDAGKGRFKACIRDDILGSVANA